MSAKKRHRTIDYLNYLKGKAEMQERHELERELEADPFARDAMEGLESMDPEHLEKDVLALHGRLRKRLSRRKRIRWYSIAATAASILIVGTIFMQIYDSDPTAGDLEPDVFLEESQAETVAEEEKARPAMAPTEEAMPESAPSEKALQESAPPVTDPTLAPAVAAASTPEPVPEPEAEPKTKTQAAPAEPESKVLAETHMEADGRTEAAFEAAPEMARAKKGRRSTLDHVMVSEATFADEMATDVGPDMGSHIGPDMETGMISGVVLFSEDMQPLPGANITLKEAGRGVSADMLGRFSIPVPADTFLTLQTSFVGMEDREFPVTGGEHMQLVLHPDPSVLDEIILSQGGPEAVVHELYRQAEPENGFRSYGRYIRKNLRYPEPAPRDRQVVILLFRLTADGAMTGFVPIRSPGPAFTAEAIRLLTEGPPWRPAESPAGPMDEVVSIRIVFKQ